jgi:acetolactate synthase-1/2/3 large subunit
MTENVAARYLAALAEHGIESLFVNAGTDFAPIVEAYARNKEVGGATLPTPMVCAHENLAAGMAHGAYLAAGRPQALMLHVSVGTANAVCAVTNAAREHVPMLVTAGRSPILEEGALGARDMSIHWAQEMFDQAGMLREVVKWDYELRDARQVDAVVDRALSVATAHPRGPVYLALPREVLAAPAGSAPLRHTPVPPGVALMLRSARWLRMGYGVNSGSTAAWATNASGAGAVRAGIHGTSHSTNSTTSARSRIAASWLPRWCGWSWRTFR